MNIRVVVVNDSATMRAAIRAALAPERDIDVVAECSDGSTAASVVAASHASVVLMDVVMPHVDGYAATRAIMARTPTPIVLVSSVVDPRDAAVALEALRSGALAVAEALPSPGDPRYPQRRAAFVRLVRSASQVKLGNAVVTGGTAATPSPMRTAPGVSSHVAAIGIAASTGGPGALVDILSALPHGRMPPIVVVQHIAPGFATGLAQWLGDVTHHPAIVATHGETLRAGAIYIAPDDRHIGLTGDLRAVVSDAPPVKLFRPSGTFMLASMADTLGPSALGVVLTGMGDDAAAGAVKLRHAGGRVAVQDEATSVVYGMPRATLEAGGADDVLPLGRIAEWIMTGCGIS